ncbi:DUF1640 domain-containing protein [Candidatus Magnetobacterium casensis]|uniref:DUF1640 domain-containing protein n=2 Tax=Candidatus Magnetobacterium casense TaxID=1455061 RepID=A0ABS6RZ99_9BACT|nr:DUF1640 domain-containing protein [Candidatus Magnetobacterium casensis]
MSVITIPRILREKLGDEAVEAFAKVISEAGLDTRRDLATKEDLFKVETRLKENITKVKEDVSKTEGRLREDIAKVKEDIAKVKEDVNKTEGRLREEIAKVKEDVNKTEGRLREEIAKVKEDSAKIREDVAKISGEMVLLKLMLGGMLAGMISLIVKTFFMH